jgi:hypothetical protein
VDAGVMLAESPVDTKLVLAVLTSVVMKLLTT